MPHSVSAGEVVTHEGLVHQDERGAARNFALIPEAAADKRDLQGGEVFGADEFYVSLLGWEGGFPKNSAGWPPAAVGRSAFVDIPAERTPGIAAIFSWRSV